MCITEMNRIHISMAMENRSGRERVETNLMPHPSMDFKPNQIDSFYSQFHSIDATNEYAHISSSIMNPEL